MTIALITITHTTMVEPGESVPYHGPPFGTMFGHSHGNRPAYTEPMYAGVVVRVGKSVFFLMLDTPYYVGYHPSKVDYVHHPPPPP